MATSLTTLRLTTPRTSRRQQLLFTREELRQLLNEDLRRERKACCGLHALHEREQKGPGKATDRLEKSCRLVQLHAAQIERILQDLDGKVNADYDELNAILGASRVVEPAWIADTIYNLHERARQLRTAGFSGLAKRMMRIVAEKQRDAMR